MSSCIKDLYDYDLLKKCCSCRIISLKSNFQRKLSSKFGLDPRCIPCMRKNHLDNRDRVRQYCLNNQDGLNVYQKKYNYESREKINLYIKNRIKTDVTFRLICNTRRKIRHALNGKSKSSSTGEILVIDIETYRKWIDNQVIPGRDWKKIGIDHVKPNCSFDISKEEKLKEEFCRKNTQPLLKQDHLQKGTKDNFLDYQLQFIKAYQFVSINDQERPN